jgi:glycopeptide antibiotics resistance protein
VKSTGRAWIAGATALIVAMVYPWGDVQDHAHWWKVAWIPFASPPFRPVDIAANVLLFVPVGVGAALLFRRARLAAGLLALTLSIGGEAVQLYSHSRFPSATDLACNVAGALAAACVVKSRAAQRLRWLIASDARG